MYPYVRLNKIKFTQSFTEKRFVLGYSLAGIWKKILPFSKSTPSTFSVSEVLCKSKKYLSSREKKCFTWVFSDWNSKNPFSYLKSSPSNLSKFGAKIKTLKLGTKNALIRSFEPQFWKTIVILNTSALEFVSLQSLVKK